MSRPLGQGLNYFSLDVDMDGDDKIELIEAKHGLIAFGVIVRLLMRIYKNGYFIQWTEKEKYLFVKNTQIEMLILDKIIEECFKEKFFSREIFDKYKVLTSSGIQKRYLAGSVRRKFVTIYKEYFLLKQNCPEIKILKHGLTLIPINDDINDEDVNIDSKNADMMSDQCKHDVDINEVNDDKNPVKEKKGKERKGKEIEEEEEEKKSSSPEFDFVKYFATKFPVPNRMWAEVLDDLSKRYPETWLKEAANRFLQAGATSVNYLDSMLKKWQKIGGEEPWNEQYSGVNYGKTSEVKRRMGKISSSIGARPSETDWDTEPEHL